MYCVNYEASAAWCRAHGYPVNQTNFYGRPEPAVREQFEELALGYPTDSGGKILLAKRVIDWARASGDVFLWVDDWAVWPSVQHMPMFERFRQGLGEGRPLIEAPGHVAGVDDRDDAVSVLAHALLSYWDCYVFATDRRPVFFCSHDEWCALLVAPDGPSVDIQEAFAEYLNEEEGGDGA